MKRVELNIGSPENVATAAELCAASLQQPQAVLLVPTETVYGLVCRHDDRPAVERIYDLKARSENKPLALFVASPQQLIDMGIQLPQSALKLAAAFCPGPVTLIVMGPDGKTVGFRIPDHPLILQLLKKVGFPLASTSANRSGRPNAMTVAQALAELDGQPDITVDSGPLPPDAQASTVIDLSQGGWKILREGPVSAADIERILN